MVDQAPRQFLRPKEHPAATQCLRDWEGQVHRLMYLRSTASRASGLERSHVTESGAKANSTYTPVVVINEASAGWPLGVP